MAAIVVDLSRSLREALHETLTAILSPVQSVRATAEEQIKALEVTEEFGVHLAEFTLDVSVHLGVRQLASVLLKHYVETHWSTFAEKFCPPETTDAAKAAIRQILPLGLKENVSKVRSSVAYAISAIAHWDWPDAWPQLFDVLMQSLTSGDANSVHGAMRALTEFSREVTDAQMPGVAPVILPEMYRIFVELEKYNVRTRGRAVEIFCTCATVIANMAELDKAIPKTLLFPVLPMFTEALVRSLQDKNPVTSDSGLKMEALKALTVLIRHFPQRMSTWLPQILTPVWNTLTESASVYVRTVVNDTDEENGAVDSDGEVLGFENLVFCIFEFVHGLVEASKFRATVRKGMDDLIYYVILYMQITEDQVSTWSENLDRFVEDEDDDTFSFSVRISALDLLLTLAEEFEEECVSGLISSVNKHLQEADVARASGNQFWWKIHESCILAIGNMKDFLIDQLQETKVRFDLNGFLQTVVLNHVSIGGSSFLIGRCLWFAGRFSTVMSLELVQRFLEATVKNLHDSELPVVKISSVRAVCGFADHLKKSNSMAILNPFLESILDGLLALATRFSSEVLSLVLEALCVLLSTNQAFTHTCEPKVTPLAIAVFLKYNGDPVITSFVQDLFKVLVENPACRLAVQQRLLPTLISIFNASTDKIPMGLQAVALDILLSVIRANGAPLTIALVEQAFPAMVHCVLNSDDNSTLQNGGECLRAYVSVDMEQVARWRDDRGRDGLWYAMQIAARLLDPRASEYTATFIGRLVSILVAKAGSLLGENLDLLLKGVLSKMQQAESLAVTQSLVLVFAHLIHGQMEAVLEFLSGVPGPTGKSALDFVLIEWCSKQHLFFGSYERKVSTLALCKVLQHGVTTQDARLTDIQVKGDQVITPTVGVKTRSQAKQRPDQWTVIPLLVKICKLVIYELSNIMESAMSQGKDVDAEEDDDEDDNEIDGDFVDDNGDNGADDDDVDSVEVETQESSFINYLASSADLSDIYECENVEETDPDVLADPLYAVDSRSSLCQFLQFFARLPCYGAFVPHFSAPEKQVLAKLGIVA